MKQTQELASVTDPRIYATIRRRAFALSLLLATLIGCGADDSSVYDGLVDADGVDAPLDAEEGGPLDSGVPVPPPAPCGLDCPDAYYVSVEGGGDCRSASPCRLEEAQSMVQPGESILFFAGSFGDLAFGTDSPLGVTGEPIRYAPVDGEAVVLSRIYFGPHDTPYHVVVEGMRVESSGTAVSIRDNPGSVTLFRNTLVGAWGETLEEIKNNHGVLAKSDVQMNDIVIRENEAVGFDRAVQIQGAISDVAITNNHLHKSAASLVFLSHNYGQGGIVVEGNHLHNQERLGSAHGSCIALYSDNVTITDNRIHDCGRSAGILTYSRHGHSVWPDGGFSNLTITGNLIYDVHNVYPLRLGLLGHNVVVTQNTVVGRYRDVEDLRYRYSTALAMSAAPDRIRGGIVRLRHNIFVGAATLPSDLGDEFDEGGNIFWSTRFGDWLTENIIPGSDSLILTGTYRRMNTDPRRGESFSEGYFEGSGSFFVGGADFDEYSYTPSHGINLNRDYFPAVSRDACTLGSTSPRGYVGALPCDESLPY